MQYFKCKKYKVKQDKNLKKQSFMIFYYLLSYHKSKYLLCSLSQIEPCDLLCQPCNCHMTQKVHKRRVHLFSRKKSDMLNTCSLEDQKS